MSKGKNYSKNNTGNRNKSDFYETPYSLTRELLNVEDLVGTILEPACGDGAIVKVLNEFGYKCDYSDKENDFLKQDKFYDNIITNPPYKMAYEFIQKAKELSNIFYMLLPLTYLHGKKRFDDLYNNSDYKLEKIYVFTRYPMLGDILREDGLFRTGMQVYAWYKWNKDYKGTPSIEWLDIDRYVLRKCNKEMN